MAGRTTSLRARLFRTIILALLATALCASGVRFLLAREMSNRLYDSTLEVVALTISRDVILSEGDILADELLSRLVAALGDPVYYRVIAPGGRFVTGYSSGPEGSPARDAELETGVTVFYDGDYFGEPVRGVVLREFVADDEFGGWTTVEVWQTVGRRADLTIELLAQTVLILANVLVVVAIGVLYGINVGLRPLAELSASVLQRTPRDLSPIEHEVPGEIEPLRDALNGLIGEVRGAIRRRDAFISDAAHQLRNPIAGVGALLDVARGAEDEHERQEIIAEAQAAMSRVSRLTSQLLSLETLEGRADASEPARIDLGALAAAAATRAAGRVISSGAELSFDALDGPATVLAPPGLLDEAVDNLLDNACLYGLQPGGMLCIAMERTSCAIRLVVEDDGPGIAQERAPYIFSRFHRGGEDGHRGSGLGLAIARRIAENCGGSLTLETSRAGARFVLSLPAVS